MENSHEFLFLKGKAVSESLVQHQKHFPESTLEGSGKEKEVKAYLQIQLNQVVPFNPVPFNHML